MAEPFMRRRSRADARTDESVGAFARRRIGAEAVAYLVNPLVAGIYAGDPDRLSAHHTCEALVAMERRYGSVFLGALRNRRRPPRRAPVTFRQGMDTLPGALAARLMGEIRFRTRVRECQPCGSRWIVRCQSDGRTYSQEADAVVFAGSADAVHAIGLPAPLTERLAPLGAVVAPPVATVSLGFPREAVAHPLDGFGFLVPERERASVLGVVFASSVFPDRAPADHVLLTCFIGGARAPGLALERQETLVGCARRDLDRLLGVDRHATATFTAVARFPRAIPQYDVGYDTITAAVERAEADFPGVHFAGSYRGGASLPACVASGLAIAERVAPRLGATACSPLVPALT
jgi:oxygen-dependent protoporphyrinogen oxidase